MILYWVFMILMAFMSIHAQLKDRAENLAAYAYKKNFHAKFENYRSMREGIERIGGRRGDPDYPSDYSAQRLDQQDDEDDSQLLANHRNR